MLATKHAHENDGRITFFEDGHFYVVDGDKNYVSVTTFIHSFFPAFNAPEVLKKMRRSKNWGNSPYYGKLDTEIIEQWQEKKENAARLGSLLHAYIEDYYNGIVLENDAYSTVAHEIEIFHDFYTQNSKEAVPYRTEWSIFDKDLRIAGMIDMVFHKSGHDPDVVSIFDWKRVACVKTHNQYQKGLSPLTHLDDCNYIHYSLQLNLYKYILEKNYGKKVTEMKLVLLHPENETFVLVDVPVMTTDIELLVQQRLKEIQPRQRLLSHSIVGTSDKRDLSRPSDQNQA